MCGRFSLVNPERAYALFLKRARETVWKSRYNISPGETLAAVTADAEGGRETTAMVWGFRAGTRSLVNARSETVAEKPAFRHSFPARRCLLPADGFYEWMRDGNGGPRPYHFTLRGNQPFGIAAIWQTGDAGHPPAFCLLTTEANDLMRPIHHRMPVLLDPGAADNWLAPEATAAGLASLLTTLPAELMEVRAVSPHVNKAGREGPECLAPWNGPDEIQLELF